MSGHAWQAPETGEDATKEDATKAWLDRMREVALYHATPIHYLPTVLAEGALLAKSVLAARGISPRATALRRDRMLDLADFVHFSFDIATPLLRDKLGKGFPHALLVFEGASLAALPHHALLPYNTKAWRTRAAYRPIEEPVEKMAALRRHVCRRELPSLEFVVKYAVALDMAVETVFVTVEEMEWVAALCKAIRLPMPRAGRLDPSLAPAGYRPVTSGAILAYFSACRDAGRLLAPPQDIDFD